MVDAVAVADQSLGDAAEIEQAIPIGIVACHARDFQREHDADVAERNFRSHARKSRALGESGAGYTQVFVDGRSLAAWPNRVPVLSRPKHAGARWTRGCTRLDWERTGECRQRQRVGYGWALLWPGHS